MMEWPEESRQVSNACGTPLDQQLTCTVSRHLDNAFPLWKQRSHQFIQYQKVTTAGHSDGFTHNLAIRGHSQTWATHQQYRRRLVNLRNVGDLLASLVESVRASECGYRHIDATVAQKFKRVFARITR